MKLPELKEDVVEVKEFVPDIPKVLEKEEIKPLINETKEEIEIPEINFDETALENDLKELEDIKNKFNEINVPEVEVKKEELSKPQVFSSVYVARQDNKESNNKEVSVTKDDTKDKMLFIEDDEDMMDLPSLKNEDNNSPLDNISGETYNL